MSATRISIKPFYWIRPFKYELPMFLFPFNIFLFASFVFRLIGLSNVLRRIPFSARKNIESHTTKRWLVVSTNKKYEILLSFIKTFRAILKVVLYRFYLHLRYFSFFVLLLLKNFSFFHIFFLSHFFFFEQSLKKKNYDIQIIFCLRDSIKF